ncbi:MAG: asparagine synthase (glutamine-hydrolyzing) [Oleiphilus sp.]|nr:MAG: asparagine synthase (glutamine-hydrolyzing) [Oleiphilus sp.]
MCGFFGIVGSVVDDFRERALHAALDGLAHRGPDNQATWSSSNVILGHTRLSILDLSNHANQPFSSTCGRFTVAYNGEVYNYKELAAQYSLINLKTSSDTEVVVELFAKLGVASFEQLNGMFALAIYDSEECKLYLARDRLGIKPLYITKSEQSICFGSEIKALEKLGAVSNDVNAPKLNEWFYYGNALGRATILNGVERVMPGNYVVIDTTLCSAAVHTYWAVSKALSRKNPSKIPSEEHAVAKVRELLCSAVKRQLVSDVPVGVFLSGGIDSSAITAFAAQELGRDLSTYSVKFDYDKGVNELPKARQVADMYGTKHHEFEIGGYDVVDTVIKMVEHHDHPFSDAANIPLFLLSQQVRDKTKVILQGDGGDELFAGYQRYNTLANFRKMKLLAKVGNIANNFTRKNAGYYSRQRYIDALLAGEDYQVMAALLTVESKRVPPTRVLSDSYRAKVESHAFDSRYQEIAKKFEAQDLVNKMLMTDLEIILPDIFLEKVDRSTMAASVEVRVPFLDSDLVDFCISLPSRLKVKKGQQKYLLKQALAGVVPRDILYGPKTGFGVPFGYWLKGPLKELFWDGFAKFKLDNPHVFDEKKVARVFSEFTDGRRDDSFLFWKMLNLMIWANTKKVVF